MSPASTLCPSVQAEVRRQAETRRSEGEGEGRRCQAWCQVGSCREASMYTFLFRQNQIGRQVPAIPETVEDSYDGSEISGYGYTRDSNEYGEMRGQGRREGYESGGRRQGYEQVEERGGKTVEEILQSSEEDNEVKGEEGACGPECRNLMHESEHPKEDDRCPYEGMVIDIWGYCR